MNDQFYRMKRMPPYVIAEVNAMRHAARLAGQDIIDLGIDPASQMRDIPGPQRGENQRIDDIGPVGALADLDPAQNVIGGAARRGASILVLVRYHQLKAPPE